MAYDPQAERQRPKPTPEGPAPVDALLVKGTPKFGGSRPDADASGAGAAERSDASPQTNDPPPTPAVTPEPADPPPDKLLLNSALVSAAGVLVGALLLRCICRRWCGNDSGG